MWIEIQRTNEQAGGNDWTRKRDKQGEQVSLSNWVCLLVMGFVFGRLKMTLLHTKKVIRTAGKITRSVLFALVSL